MYSQLEKIAKMLIGQSHKYTEDQVIKLLKQIIVSEDLVLLTPENPCHFYGTEISISAAEPEYKPYRKLKEFSLELCGHLSKLDQLSAEITKVRYETQSLIEKMEGLYEKAQKL